MNTYKLIATDLDGTLLGSDMKVSEENLRAIRELTQSGVHVVPTTGRTIAEMGDVFNIPEFRYVIYSNGSAICDKLTGETMFFGINEENARFVYDIISKFDVLIVLHKDGKCYIEREKAQRYSDFNLIWEICNILDNSAEKVEYEEMKEKFLFGGFESCSLFFKIQEDMDNCKKNVDTNPSLRSVFCWNLNLEIFCKDAGKENALNALVKKLVIDMKDVISVGDSDNDRQMTMVSGLGLATENACEPLKAVAKEVICSNDEHVLEYIKSHYFV